MTEADHERIRLMLQDDPSLTLIEMCDRLVDEGGPAVSRSTMMRAVQKLGFTRKKMHRGSTRSRRCG